MKRTVDWIGAALVVLAIGWVIDRFLDRMERLFRVSTGQSPGEPLQLEQAGVNDESFTVVAPFDPSEFSMPDPQRENVAVLRPGESPLSFLESQ